MYKQKDFEAINYLLFAKELEKLNPTAQDLWENNKKDDLKNQLRREKIDEAFKRIKTVKDVILKKRYYYQIFKLLSFLKDQNQTVEIYEAYSKKYNSRDFLDNWALFYRMIAEKDDIRMNYLATQVFARGTDNKFDIKWYFNRSIPIEKVLKFARTNEEIANVYVLYSFRKIDQNLDNLKKVHHYNPKNIGLSFLLLREINKLEDWILTPTYTMYLPSIREDYWENSNDQRILNRVEVDRKYALEVLKFVNSVDVNSVDDKDFWMLSKSYLEFLTKNYVTAIKTINSFEMQIKSEKIKHQCEMVKALIITANQEKTTAKISKSIENIIIKEQNNKHFIFAIAKELEILNDKVDAVFLISKIKQSYDDEEMGVFWKSRSGKATLQDDFYYDWYSYADAELSVYDMRLLINSVDSKTPSVFEKWKTNELKKEKNKINDLIALKYMRTDNLNMAYQYFLKVDKNHYTNNPLFNENPFYKIKGYMNFDDSKKSNNLTKAKVVNSLIKLIENANKVENKNRNKSYFLVANCYYNMSYHGNSWMMKRISRTGSFDLNYEDELEYYCSSKAKLYYQKALENSNSKEFKAVCMYMIAKCTAAKDEYLLFKQKKYYYTQKEDYDKINNEAFSDIKSKYPDQYIEFLSNCEIFSEYFKHKK
ncbi:MAG: hypothetical protein V4548_04050 [Bacteroidota bacterium]